MDKAYTLIELSAHERSRQSIIFGSPIDLIAGPYGFKLAVFEPGQTLGYERWKANEHGTNSWQFFVLKTSAGQVSHKVAGIYPGAEILFRTRGKQATQRALTWLKTMRLSAHINPQDAGDICWRRLANQRLIRADYPAPQTFAGGSKST